jgi:hypothetical protein
MNPDCLELVLFLKINKEYWVDAKIIDSTFANETKKAQIVATEAVRAQAAATEAALQFDDGLNWFWRIYSSYT